MVLTKEQLRSESAKKLWDKYFGFLDEKPKKSTDSSTIVYLDERRGYAQRGKAGKKADLQKCGQASVLEEISSQFRQSNANDDNQKCNSKSFSPERAVAAEDLSTKITKESNPAIFEQEEAFSPASACNLHDVITYSQNKGVIGEEALSVSIFLALINKSSFGVEGYSGSGKTFITDKFLELVDDKVYQLGLSSKQAIFQDIHQINGKKIIYIPELQKAMHDRNSPLIEVIKDLTEGKDSTMLVTQKSGKGTVEYTIKKGLCVVYTLALENCFKKDQESCRRFLRLRTDNSKEHLEEIRHYKAKKRYSLSSEQEKNALEEKLRAHLNECTELNNLKVIDPFAEYISSLIPRTQKSIGYVDHYYSLLDACAKFHHHERTKIQINNQTYLLINLEDHFTVYKAYFKEFIRSLKEFSENIDKENNSDSEIGEIEQFNDILDPDWNGCYQSGLELVFSDSALRPLVDNYPEKIIDWTGRQEKDNKILALDYITGKKVVIADTIDLVQLTYGVDS